MRSNRGRDTKREVSAPQIKGLRRTTDLVFPTERVAVYWADKVAANRARDAHTDQRLADAGWVSIRMLGA